MWNLILTTRIKKLPNWLYVVLESIVIMLNMTQLFIHVNVFVLQCLFESIYIVGVSS